MDAMLQETSALPSCMLCDNVSLCLGTIIGVNSVDVCVDCFIMTSSVCQVAHTSCTVMCISMETRKKVTNHRGQSQNKTSGFKRTCLTCEWVEEIGNVLHLKLLYSSQIHQKLATRYMNYSRSLKAQKGGHNRKLYRCLAWQVPIENSNVDSSRWLFKSK